jgi:2-polyprenyl-3-methyl-5-hydroxy-6-metoxy-1,4-benzoquinol methylase
MKDNAVSGHYDAVAEGYQQQYDRELLMSQPVYPANYFRLQSLLASFLKRKVKRVIEVGVGEGTPMATLAKAGIETWGFDISKEMVKRSKEKLTQLGADPSRVCWGDIQEPSSYEDCMREGLFDGLVAMGVMPHIEDDIQTLKNMAACVRPGGSVFIEFRNKFFSLFTFNRYTLEFVLDDLLKDVSPKLKDAVRRELEPRLRMDMPPVRAQVEGKGAPGYDAILSKFHNPFEVQDVFKKLGFSDISFHWYHYHPAMPYLEGQDKALFRKEAVALEHESSGWRGMFLCSAFVIEATR